MRVAVGVPTMNNFKGLAELFASLWGHEFTPYVFNNWVNNQGVSVAWNDILMATRHFDLTVICNDDIVFHEGSFRKLLSAWSQVPLDTILVTAANGEFKEDFLKSPDYSCFSVIADEYIKEIGLFDENFTPAYFEDNDSHYRIKLAKRGALSVNAAQITHKGSQTQNGNPNGPVVTSAMFERNRDYYVQKWGGQPGAETFAVPYGDTTKDWKYWRDR